MNDPILLFIVGFCGIAVGWVICSFGTWQRVHQQESHIRRLVVDIKVLQDMKAEVPADWVISELETMVANDYR